MIASFSIFYILVLLVYSINFNGIWIMENVTPLNVLGKRVVPNLPLHFTKISIPCDSWNLWNLRIPRKPRVHGYHAVRRLSKWNLQTSVVLEFNSFQPRNGSYLQNLRREGPSRGSGLGSAGSRDLWDPA